MSKRIKSFFISLASFIIPAIGAIILTPEWAKLVSDLNNWIISLGIPASLTVVAGLLIAELWKNWINTAKINRLNREGIIVSGAEVDLY